MLRISLTLLFVALFCVAICAQKESDPGWKDIASDYLFHYQYSSNRVTTTPQGTIKFSMRFSPTVEGFIDQKARDAVIGVRQQYHKPVNGYGQWAYALVEYEANCSQQKYRTLGWTDYKASGTALGSETATEEWLDVAPGSIAEEMLKKVCHAK
jgi:hypothetical protein